MDSHGCSLRVLGAIMDVPWMCSQCIRRDVWIVIYMYEVLGGMCG